MSGSGPFGEDFENIPFLSELMKLLGQQGSGWESAKQLAMGIATGGESEPNVEPTTRIALTSLSRVAELQISGRTGLPVPGNGLLEVEPVTRAVWASKSLDALRPLFDELTGSLTSAPAGEGIDDDPSMALFGGLMQAMGPMMLSVMAGTMIGRLATRSMGTYDLPIPREGPLLLAVPNIESFGLDWSLPEDDLRLWVCLHEVTHHLVLGVPHIRDRMRSLLERHAAGFETNPAALEDKLDGLDLGSDPMALANLGNVLDPETILGAVQSPAQRALLPDLEALVAVVVGYVDHVMDELGSELIPSYGQVTEALRRRRVETDEADRFVEQILGLNLTQEQVDRGHAFVAGVVERAGDDGLAQLFRSERMLPTPNEVDAPGLWLARIEYD